jgi:DNA-binding PadR family transcriptional regulator
MRHQGGRGCGFRDSNFFNRGFGPDEAPFFGGGRFEAGRGRGPFGGRGGGHGHGHGHGRHGGFGGGGLFGAMGMMGEMARMRGGRVLSSDDLQLVILSLIEEKPRHGYEIIKALEEKSSGIYKPSPGMIYPALTYLEEADFVAASMEGSKKQITLTAEGKKHLDENRDHINDVLERLQRYGEKMSHFQSRMAEEEEAEDQWREMRDDFREIREELRYVFSAFAESKEERKRVLDILKKALKEIRAGKSTK